MSMDVDVDVEYLVPERNIIKHREVKPYGIMNTRRETSRVLASRSHDTRSSPFDGVEDRGNTLEQSRLLNLRHAWG